MIRQETSGLIKVVLLLYTRTTLCAAFLALTGDYRHRDLREQIFALGRIFECYGRAIVAVDIDIA